MRNVRRYYMPNDIVLITAVTHHRRSVFGSDSDVELLFDTMRAVQALHPCHLFAYVILPDHLHWLMRTPEDITFSEAMHSIKRNFTMNYKSAHGITHPLSLWQARFHDHIIRDEDDFARRFDNAHYNAVHHGLVSRSEDGKWSSFHFWVEKGIYELGWGHDEPANIQGMDLD